MHDLQSFALNQVGKIVTGRTPPTNSPHLLGRGVAFITPTDISDTSIFASPKRRLSDDGRKVFERILLPTDTLCFTCIASIGSMCMTNEVSITNQQINSIVVNAERFSARWLFYMLKSMKSEIIAIASGSATPIINKTSFGNIKILAPSVRNQQRLAEVLGAYDDLIELNRRRVTLLEDMARGLFEDWFVRFRSPGIDETEAQEALKGNLPEGCYHGELGEVATLRSGFAFKSSMFVEDGPYGLVTIKHVHDGRIVPPFRSRVTDLPSNLPSYCLIQEGDVLVSLTGNVGRTCQAWGTNLLLNQRVAKVVPKASFWTAFCYCWLRSPATQAALRNLANGVAQQNLSPIAALRLPIILPPDAVATRFQSVVGPMLQAQRSLEKANSILAASRDLLLPRLISGQLSVTDAEHELAQAA